MPLDGSLTTYCVSSPLGGWEDEGQKQQQMVSNKSLVFLKTDVKKAKKTHDFLLPPWFL